MKAYCSFLHGQATPFFKRLLVYQEAEVMLLQPSDFLLRSDILLMLNSLTTNVVNFVVGEVEDRSDLFIRAVLALFDCRSSSSES